MRLCSILLPFALLSALVATPFCQASTITGVSFYGSAAAPTVTITGTGFGSTAPPTSSPAVGTGFDYGTSLYLEDDSRAFGGGFQDSSVHRYDFIGLLLLNYSDTFITYQLGSFYATGGYDLASGDAYTVGVRGTTFSGEVAYTPEPSSFALLGTGLLCVVGAARRRFVKA